MEFLSNQEARPPAVCIFSKRLDQKVWASEDCGPGGTNPLVLPCFTAFAPRRTTEACTLQPCTLQCEGFIRLRCGCLLSCPATPQAVHPYTRQAIDGTAEAKQQNKRSRLHCPHCWSASGFGAQDLEGAGQECRFRTPAVWRQWGFRRSCNAGQGTSSSSYLAGVVQLRCCRLFAHCASHFGSASSSLSHLKFYFAA